MAKPVKTVAMRVLEAHGIEYEPKYYEVVEHLSAAEVAAVLGLAPEQTFKTLVVLSERAGAAHPGAGARRQPARSEEAGAARAARRKCRWRPTARPNV